MKANREVGSYKERREAYDRREMQGGRRKESKIEGAKLRICCRSRPGVSSGWHEPKAYEVRLGRA